MVMLLKYPASEHKKQMHYICFAVNSRMVLSLRIIWKMKWYVLCAVFVRASVGVAARCHSIAIRYQQSLMITLTY
eukprot:3289965-Amphidinium_carterae.1